MLKFASASLAFLVATGCAPSRALTAQELDGLYPPAGTTVAYHSEWTKKNYPARIASFRKDPLRHGDIVFIGNSITEQGGDWSARFGVKGIRNRGISGDVTDGVLLRLNEMAHFEPKAVFLLIGINDLYGFHNKTGIPSPEYVAANILKISETIRKGAPKARIYIQTILPTSNEYLRDPIARVNRIIMNGAAGGTYEAIDLHAAFRNEQGLIRAELTNDGTHLNSTGYDTWVNFLRPLVRK